MAARRRSTRVWSRALDVLSMYLPVLVMGVLALGTYWLVRNAPSVVDVRAEKPVRKDPDYTLQDFAVRSFDVHGRLVSEVHGKQARHFPNNDLLEIEQVRMRSVDAQGRVSTAAADRALSNGDGSEVKLYGNARLQREGTPPGLARANGRTDPDAPLAFAGEFLHVFSRDERVLSDQPVVLTRGADRFTADSLAFDNPARVLELRGRVRGTLAPRP
jgi:lipopolysaccharide export system protein LptC